MIHESNQENVKKVKVNTNATQLTRPTPTFSKMGLNVSSFELNLNSSATAEPRKTFQAAKVLSPKIAQRRPTHQEASSIYFMAKEDIFKEIRADVDR